MTSSFRRAKSAARDCGRITGRSISLGNGEPSYKGSGGCIMMKSLEWKFFTRRRRDVGATERHDVSVGLAAQRILIFTAVNVAQPRGWSHERGA